LSIRLSLVVYCLLPSSSRLAISPVEFKARVTDPNGRLVESANVTFYVDSIMIGSSLTSSNGIANLSSEVTSGNHFWFASASKGGRAEYQRPALSWWRNQHPSQQATSAFGISSRPIPGACSWQRLTCIHCHMC